MLEVNKSLLIDVCYFSLYQRLQDVCTVYILQLKQLKLELHNAINSQRWTPDSYLVAKPYVPVNGPSAQQHTHRIPLKPTTKKPYVSVMLHCLI